MTPDDIRAIRARLNETQDQFAVRIGVSVETVRKWEQGKVTPGPDKIARIGYAAADKTVRAQRLSESLAGTAALFDNDARMEIADGHPESAERLQKIANHLRRIADNHQSSGVDPLQIT